MPGYPIVLVFTLLAALPAWGQITATPAAVTAQAGTTGGANVVVCGLTATGATCTAGGKVYAMWTAGPMPNGADAGNTVSWNGNTVSLGLHMRSGVISWTVTVQTGSAAAVKQSGTFSTGPPPVASGPPPIPTLGTLVAGVCQGTGTGFHVVAGNLVLNSVNGKYVSGAPGYLLSNEPQANCLMP